MSASIFSPVQVTNWNDPGDETLRNFRYQVCYGIILLADSIINRADRKAYISVYCEQQDDFLCELPNGKYDAIQIKTSTPENGEWQITDEQILKTIYRFYHIETTYPNYIENYYIVSNTRYADRRSKDVTELAKCPTTFCEAISLLNHNNDNKEGFINTYINIKEYIFKKGISSINDKTLLSVLRRIHWTSGPSRDGFFEFIVQSHLTQIPGISSWQNNKIIKFANEIVLRIFNSSSLSNAQPDRWTVTNSKCNQHIYINHKRIFIDEIKKLVQFYENDNNLASDYYSSYEPIRLAAIDRAMPITSEKMQVGQIQHKHISRIKDLALTAERKLMELSKIPGFDENNIKVIEGMVQSICEEAELSATLNSDGENAYGSKMLSSVYSSLRTVSNNDSKVIYGQPYELLLGVAGLLTEECKIWWSPEFILKGSQI
ncbi:dsDNA nuclease domain-containing protein [Hymenobacter yonginensis]|uniref:DsDNA nuclease domain-containing protein n=1 Tax=Hymenobacter yonginensis TaxID=748197 RepID=A0ABY7PTP7_9BACT|nr:dsDNA nuclease domain-containing protein [Hymenobacter yonginensis]WBO86280.1 dsDNA nuclease domain-containing protein [Hymenobacter yonginensis]